MTSRYIEQRTTPSMMMVWLQVLIALLCLYIAWRVHQNNTCSSTLSGAESASAFTGTRGTFGSTRFRSTTTVGNAAYPLTSTTCATLMVPQALDSLSEEANQTYASTSSGGSFPVSEEDELNALVSLLQQYYFWSYNLWYSSTASAAYPFTNDQCYKLLSHEPNQTQYERLSQDIEAYGALAVNQGKTADVVSALVMVYFTTRVRVIQVQNATVNLSSAIIYTPATDTITFSPQFIQIVSPQLGPKTKALLTVGSCTPAQLASTLLLTGEHNPTWEALSTGKHSWTFVCGAPS